MPGFLKDFKGGFFDTPFWNRKFYYMHNRQLSKI
jgi:hypothetical protein